MVIIGKVIHGDGEGRLLGYPTANLKLDDELNISAGVYAAMVDLDSIKKTALAIVGAHGDSKRFEVYLLDFDDDLYGQELVVTLDQKIREILEFDGNEDFMAQVEKDVQAIRKIFK